MRAEFEDVLRFWLDRGVDGFRVDVAHGMVKADGLPDVGYSSLTGRDQRQSRLLGNGTAAVLRPGRRARDLPRPGARSWTATRASRMAVAEAWAATPQRLARYVGPDELHQAFNFDFLDATWTADSFRKVIDTSLAESSDRRRTDHLGAVQPRQAAARHPVRRRRRRPAPGPGRRPADAGPARLAPTSTRARSWACPRCSTCPTSVRQDPAFRRTGDEPRRLPGADAVGRRRAAVRLRAGGLRRLWLPAPADLGGAQRGGADRRPGVHPGAVPGGAARSAARTPRSVAAS